MSPLIFFVLIIGIDLFLKSIKDKKKIEEVRQKKIEELRNKKEAKAVKSPYETKEREIHRNPSLVKTNPSLDRTKGKDNFFGQGKRYRDDNEGYTERYNDRYKDIEKSHREIQKNYEKSQNDSLYDKNTIQRTKPRDYEDVRNYGKKEEGIEVQVPTASTFRNDLLNGIIFSEILGKPKSKKRDI